ncbi:MAG: tRNA pseudouridine(13) synthase TruD [Anaerolineae bacterium]|nr:tRNA pseudouridine(13) synthase TruD [Anaerolineae bacterium]
MTPIQNPVDLPPFQLKTLNSDFMVDEIFLEPDYVSKKNATYTYLSVSKEDITTFNLLQHLAGYFKCPPSDVSAAGLKDEFAVTRQAISLRVIISNKQVKQANEHFKNNNLKITIDRLLGYGHEPIRPRLLHGNKFTITIRQLSPELAGNLANNLSRNRFFHFINYYDEQRFGLPHSIHNTHRIGQALLAGDWATAYDQYLQSGIDAIEAAQTKEALRQSGSHQIALTNSAAGKLNFFVSSYNSYVWNNALKQLIEQQPNAIQVELPHLGTIALPVDQTVPIPPSLSVEVEKTNWSSSVNYRDTKTRPVFIPVSVFMKNQSADALHPGHQAVTISFYLLTGCYATMLVKQLLLMTAIRSE